MRIDLFGGVVARADDGQALDAGPPKSQTVLAALALSAGAAVPVQRLVELVWAQRPPRTADKTVQWYVARLRKGLGRDAITRVGAAYVLNVDQADVDVLRFQQRLDAGDIDAALAEWTGRPLAGLDAPGLDAAVAALVEQWLGAVEASLEHRVARDPAATIGPLTALTAQHPFREALWALLMTALYRTGRQADALDAFQRARGHLVDELGVEPGPQLRELEAKILGHDDHLRDPEARTAGAQTRPTGTVTFGFVEIVDAMRLWDSDAEKMALAVARLDELIRGELSRHDGQVFATGESFGVAFARADEAVAWAGQLRAAVRAEPWPGGLDLQLRSALHTGAVDGGAEGYHGPAVHTAARLAAAAHGGQVLVSAATAALLDRDDLRDLGTYRLDGAVSDVRVLQVGTDRHPQLTIGPERRGNLPLRPGRLLGRRRDVQAVRAALSTSAVVTLVGPGGIGKTRLALEVARREEEAGGTRPVWLIELGNIAECSDVPRAAADVIDVPERPGQSVTESLVSALRHEAALLIVDNCEHVVAGAAALVSAIVQRCPDVMVLATSREALGIVDEQQILVGPLAVAPAVELFTQRATTVSPAFTLDSVRSDVERICRRLDGVPLAIELAAARSRVLAPSDLVARLDDQLALLTRGRRTGADRHRTLRATIGWSYDLLTEREQVVLQRLAVFAGPFDLAAAEAVVADDALSVADVDAMLGALVDRSMVLVGAGPFGRRFRLLATVRQFAAERLEGAGDGPARARHARWCLDQVRRIRALLTGHGEVEGVARLGELWPNLRTAVHWACRHYDTRLATALVRPIAAEICMRRQHEIGDWAEHILAILPPGDDAELDYWLMWATFRQMQRGDRAAFQSLTERYEPPHHPLTEFTRAYLGQDGATLTNAGRRAVGELRTRGDDHAANLVQIAGEAAGLLTSGRFDELDAVAGTLAARYGSDGPPTFAYFAQGLLGYSALFQGRHDDSDRFFAETSGIDLPMRTIQTTAPIDARAAFRRGERDRAFRILGTHVDRLLQADDFDVARVACTEFVTMMVALDRLDDAALVMGYLDATGDFGALAAETVVADAAATLRATSGRTTTAPLDARQALTHMRDVLHALIGGPSATPS